MGGCQQKVRRLFIELWMAEGHLNAGADSDSETMCSKIESNDEK